MQKSVWNEKRSRTEEEGRKETIETDGTHRRISLLLRGNPISRAAISPGERRSTDHRRACTLQNDDTSVPAKLPWDYRAWRCYTNPREPVSGAYLDATTKKKKEREREREREKKERKLVGPASIIYPLSCHLPLAVSWFFNVASDIFARIFSRGLESRQYQRSFAYFPPLFTNIHFLPLLEKSFSARLSVLYLRGFETMILKTVLG